MLLSHKNNLRLVLILIDDNRLMSERILDCFVFLIFFNFFQKTGKQESPRNVDFKRFQRTIYSIRYTLNQKGAEQNERATFFM